MAGLNKSRGILLKTCTKPVVCTGTTRSMGKLCGRPHTGILRVFKIRFKQTWSLGYSRILDLLICK